MRNKGASHIGRNLQTRSTAIMFQEASQEYLMRVVDSKCINHLVDKLLAIQLKHSVGKRWLTLFSVARQ